MHVLCYGAGAVGSLIGARLALAEASSVTLLGRRSHVAAVRTRGLAIESANGRVVCKTMDSVTSLDDLRNPPDLIVLTVKSYQTPDALTDLSDLLRRGVPILSVQNGIGNEEAIAAVAGPDRTIAGSFTISTSLTQAGVVRQNADTGGIAVAPVGDVRAGERAAALFRRAGFHTAFISDYRGMKWSKLLLNMLGNASSAILDIPPETIARDSRLFRIERAAFLEAVQVIRALGLRPVALPGYHVPLLIRVMEWPEWVGRALLPRRLGRGRGNGMPSLWVDLEKGRDRSEVEVLNGAVVNEGTRLRIAAPVNTMLTEVLLALAAGRRDRPEFHHNPEALVALHAEVRARIAAASRPAPHVGAGPGPEARGGQRNNGAKNLSRRS
jgi:2-dehydropantoate 2-reductase